MLPALLPTLKMSSRKPTGLSDDVSNATINRRQLLAAGGLLAIGGLTGCLGRIVDATTNTDAAPAAAFAGVGESQLVPAQHSATLRLSPTVRVDEGPVSGDIELEGWMTTQQTVAANYNNSRSSRGNLQEDGDSDADGVDDATEGSLAEALEIEQTLLTQVDAVQSHIDTKDRRQGTAGLTRIGESVDTVTATLENCTAEVCNVVKQNADARKGLTDTALSAVKNGEWDSAADIVQEIRSIVVSDIDRLEERLATADGGGISKRSARTGPYPSIVGADDEDMADLYAYLEKTPVIGERFALSLPDARVPIGGMGLADEVTPKRLIDYITGRAVDGGGTLYSWGHLVRTDSENNGEDNTSPIYEGDSVGGESAIHRGERVPDGGGEYGSTFYKPDTARTTAFSGLLNTGGSLEAAVTGETVTVLNTPPRTSDGHSQLAVTADGTSYVPENLDEWGEEVGDVSATPLLVSQILVQPEGCPLPLPALLYVRRCKHEDQYIYVGGWTIDDASLYDNSATALTTEGPNEIVGVGFDDVDGDGYGDVVNRQLTRERSRLGAHVFNGDVSTATDVGVLSKEALTTDGDDLLLRKRPGRASEADDDDSTGVFGVCVSLDAPIVHLVDGASDAVKFKAGAELSKSVN